VLAGIDDRRIFDISQAVFEKIAYRENSDGIIALAKPKLHSVEQLRVSENPFVIVLESVEKPGNLGAILRTADAAAVDAVIVCDPQTDLYNPSAPGSRLGVTADKLGDKLPEGITGLHIHNLCENNSYALEETLKVVESKFGHLFPQIEWLNLGGGHLMTHKDYNIEHLIGLLKDLKSRYPHLEIILEPGSAFAWQTGPLLSTVTDIVENHGVKTAMLNVSFACHMPDCLEMPYKPVIRGAYQEAVAGKPTYRMGGNSCLSGDFMGDWSFDEPLKVGDRIILKI